MTLWLQGSNSHGQLGLGFASEQETCPAEIVLNLSGPARIVTGGGKHTVVVCGDHDVYVSGANDRGQLGLDAKTPRYTFQLLQNPFKLFVKKVSCGWDFNLCLLDDGSVAGWGSNAFGQLGCGEVVEVRRARTVGKSVGSAVDVACGLRHSAIVTAGGDLYTTGSNTRGQCGLRNCQKIYCQYQRGNYYCEIRNRSITINDIQPARLYKYLLIMKL